MTAASSSRGPTRYIFTISRFHCGCIYKRATDRIYFCPTHRGMLTGEETIRLPDGMTGRPGNQPKILHMVMSEFTPNWPQVLHNTDSNSLVQTNKISAKGEEWHNWTEETGLCAACYIDDEDVVRTAAAMCECGDRDCLYRWCGRTQGLHAYWLLHAAGLTEHSTGFKDRDIFAYGPCQDQGEELTRILDEERECLNQAATERARNITDSRIQLPPWLDNLRQAAMRHPERLHKAALRLYVIQEAPRRVKSHRPASDEPEDAEQSETEDVNQFKMDLQPGAQHKQIEGQTLQ